MEASQTLYIRNLPSKLPKEELRRLLSHLFSQHGRVAQIITVKSPKMRGQAHVVFQSVQDAVSALRALQGFYFCDKPMRVEFSKRKSKVVEEREKILSGGAVQGQKRQNPSMVLTRHYCSDFDDVVLDANKTTPVIQQKKPRVEEAEVEQDDMEVEDVRPSACLLLERIAQNVNSEMLENLLRRYQGFKSVKLANGTALAEYETADQAVQAKQELDHFEVSKGQTLKISFKL